MFFLITFDIVKKTCQKGHFWTLRKKRHRGIFLGNFWATYMCERVPTRHVQMYILVVNKAMFSPTTPNSGESGGANRFAPSPTPGKNEGRVEGGKSPNWCGGKFAFRGIKYCASRHSEHRECVRFLTSFGRVLWYLSGIVDSKTRVSLTR